MNLAEEKQNADYSLVIHILFLISCTLSVISSFFTFFIYYKFRHLSKNYPARLIVLLSLSDGLLWGDRTFNLITKLIYESSFEEDNNKYCIFSCIWRCFWVLFNMCCIFLIAFSLFYEIVLKKIAEKIENLGYAISFIFCLIMSLIPFFFDQYGILDPYQCWIMDNKMNLVIFYTPVGFVTICNFIFIIYVIHYLRNLQGHFGSRTLMLKFLMFPTILVIAWLPGFIRIVGNINNETLYGFMYIFMPLQGVFNPFIYGSIFTIVKNEVLSKRKNVKDVCVAISNIKSTMDGNFSPKRMTYEDLLKIGKQRESLIKEETTMIYENGL